MSVGQVGSGEALFQVEEEQVCNQMGNGDSHGLFKFALVVFLLLLLLLLKGTNWQAS